MVNHRRLSHEMTPKKRISKKRVVTKEAVVDHTYRNYSHDLVIKSAASKDARFPAKLHRILSKPENAHIIAWRPHGRAWRVVDTHKLNSILPDYFDHGSRESFNRSTNNWGFKVCPTDILPICVLLSTT
jgi:hypothetical protein